MYSIITIDKRKEITLATFRSLKTASNKMNNFESLFSIPLQKDLLDHYRKKAFIRDTERGSKFLHIFH
jgi:hypothetical protein